MPSASRGDEREKFIRLYLKQAFPNSFRFGSGQITDKEGEKSGQLDVVVEYPFLPSLPLVGDDGGPRLYLAEGVAAVIEVKSDVASQWSQVERTLEKLADVKRRFGRVLKRMVGPGADGMTREIPDHIDPVPFFVAGYTGWKNREPLESRVGGRDKLSDTAVDGILVIDEGLFVSSRRFGSWTGTGDWSLWGLICSLEMAVNDIKQMGANPLHYSSDYHNNSQETIE